MSFSFQLSLSINHSQKLTRGSNSDKFSLYCTLPRHDTFFSICKPPFLHLTQTQFVKWIKTLSLSLRLVQNILKIRLQILPSMRWGKLNQYGRKCVIDNLNNRNATKKISFSSLLLMILTKEEIYPKREKTMIKLLEVENKT